ncbi:MAG: HlyD family efflux transporter periplasmic adaptor subunit, partial [Chloroflexaceae bacterium]|nr:HlyD family efflux transporter periplasmic adaptor subunit [Chloroflexaceae bacterium]
TRDLVLDVEDRAAQLAIARAALELLQEGATQEEINEYQARIAQAEATLAERQADINRAQADVARAQGDLLSRQGSVTGSDIEAARAELQEAIAALEDVRDGEDEAVIAQARARVEQFRVNLQAEKDRLAALKVQAEEDVNLRANELRNVQADYSRIYWDVREIERDLNSVEQQTWQELKDREEAALREVQNAESRLEQARIDLEAARLAEINGIQEAEARLEEAQADLEDLLTPPKASNVAAAEARVARARADLDKLQGAQRAGDIASASAGVSVAAAGIDTAEAQVEQAEARLAEAQASLEELTRAPRDPDVRDRQARVQQAEVALRQAELALDKAALETPISGTVVEVDLEEGERIDTSTVAVRVADFSEWEIETTDLTELGIVRVRIGDPVDITFDAIPDLTLPGVVSEIQDIGADRQGDIVYRVTIKPLEWDDRLRWRMTATVSIEPTRAEAAPASEEAAPSGTEVTE